jgi:hypothetical protein
VNYDILMSKGRKNCLCTAMLFDPTTAKPAEQTSEQFEKKSLLFERFMHLKQSRLLRALKPKAGIRIAKSFSFRSLLP